MLRLELKHNSHTAMHHLAHPGFALDSPSESKTKACSYARSLYSWYLSDALKCPAARSVFSKILESFLSSAALSLAAYLAASQYATRGW